MVVEPLTTLCYLGLEVAVVLVATGELFLNIVEEVGHRVVCLAKLSLDAS